jgi:hypothetical protein
MTIVRCKTRWMKLPQIESEKSVDSPKAVLRSSHFAAKVIVADVGVANCSKALALEAWL